MINLIALFTVCAALVAIGVRIYLAQALRHGIVDTANERSLHRGSVPRGGGIVIAIVVLVVVAIYLHIHSGFSTPMIVLLAGAFAFAVLGFCDDMFSLSSPLRLAIQLSSVVIVVAMLGPEPVAINWVDATIGLTVALVFVWIVNASNFMDGADGLLASQTILVMGGFALVSLIAGAAANNPVLALSVALAGAAGGFLFWNWNPAKVFLGDVGSYFIGFLFAATALAAPFFELAALSVLILLAPLLTDASLTLLRRILQRERWWSAHHTHVYQLYVRAGASHGKAVSIMGALSAIIMLPLATVAARVDGLAIPIVVLAYFITTGLWLLAYRSLAKIH